MSFLGRDRKKWCVEFFSLCAKLGGKNRKKKKRRQVRNFFSFEKEKDVDDDDKGQVIVVISTVSFVGFECDGGAVWGG